jgi:phosphatidylglycerophosphate synthase
MLDQRATAFIRPAVDALAGGLARAGISANQLTVTGFVIGLVASLLIANKYYLAGTLVIFASRLCDALDGAVARRTQATDRGGFLDIALDFLFYASVPLAYAFADPARNALAAAVLLAAFIGTGSSFLAFAVIAAKRNLASSAYPDKSFYFLGGLTEATETLICFAAMGLWPQHFALLAYAFAALCAVTVAMRLWWGWQAFR